MFSGKLFAVTGGASGIGLATARTLVSRGALVSLADYSADRLAEAVSALNDMGGTSSTSTSNEKPPVLGTVVDVTDAGGVRDWIKKTTEHFGIPLCGAVNMAGIITESLGTEDGKTRSLPDEEFHHTMNVHVTGTWNSVRAELPSMVTGSAGRGGGSIVNAASIAGRIAAPKSVGYITAKHAIVGLTKSAAVDEGASGIRVNAIAPGVVDTPMVQNMDHGRRVAMEAPGPMARVASPEEVANLICFLLSDEASFITGAIYNIDGGWQC